MEERLVLRRRFRNAECRELIMHERRLRRLQRRQERAQREREEAMKQTQASIPESWMQAWEEIQKANSITATAWAPGQASLWFSGSYIPDVTATTTSHTIAQPITFGSLQATGSGTISGYYRMEVT